MREAVPQDPNISLVVIRGSISLGMYAAWPIPKRAQNFVCSTVIIGLHPLDRPTQKSVVVSTIGRGLLSAHKTRWSPGFELVRVSRQVRQHLRELVIHKVAPFHPLRKVPITEEKIRR